jgi:hypothetical protein
MARLFSSARAKAREIRPEIRPGTPDTLYTFSTMSTASTASGRRASRDYDTGFPDLPRTTTWRHPEANTAPGACISAEDIDPARALHRHRRSFLSHRHKHTTSHGFIATAMEQEYLCSKDALVAIDSAIDLDDGKSVVRDDEAARPSKDGAESLDRVDGVLKDNLPIVSPTTSQFERTPESPRRRSGLFRRFRGHKD